MTGGTEKRFRGHNYIHIGKDVHIFFVSIPEFIQVFIPHIYLSDLHGRRSMGDTVIHVRIEHVVRI